MLRLPLKFLSIFNSSPLVPLPRNNQLHGLPTEILQYIASTLLPLPSAAALALSSRFVLAKLGTGYFTQLKKGSPLPPVTRTSIRELNDTAPRLSQPQQELEDFLILLDRDIRDTIYCYYCRKIHDPMKTLRWSWSGWKNGFGENMRPCAKWELNLYMHNHEHAIFIFPRRYRKLTVHKHVHSNFTFSRIQMIMKRSRLGIDSSLLRKLSTTCISYNDSYWHQTSITDQINTYARIVSGCLLLRTVHWLLFEWVDELRLPGYGTRVCPHRSALDKDLPPPFIAMPVPGAYGPRSIFRYGAGIELQRCHICATEYEIDGAECGRGLFVLRVNVWQDLGDCPSELWGPSKCKHARKVLGSPPCSTASPPWNVKAEFENSCSDAQKLQRLGTRLELPRGLYLATYKTRSSYAYRAPRPPPRSWLQIPSRRPTSAPLLDPGIDPGERAVFHFQ